MWTQDATRSYADDGRTSRRQVHAQCGRSGGCVHLLQPTGLCGAPMRKDGALCALQARAGCGPCTRGAVCVYVLQLGAEPCPRVQRCQELRPLPSRRARGARGNGVRALLSHAQGERHGRDYDLLRDVQCRGGDKSPLWPYADVPDVYAGGGEESHS